MLQRDGLNPKIRVWHLAYVDVAKIYYSGWLKDRFPNSTKEERTERFELFKAEIEKNPHRYSHQFGRELREILGGYKIEPKLICYYDRRNKFYRLGDGFNVKRPLLSKRAARLAYTGRSLYLPYTAGTKTPIRGSEINRETEETGSGAKGNPVGRSSEKYERSSPQVRIPATTPIRLPAQTLIKHRRHIPSREGQGGIYRPGA
jgi:hypothetical protein